MGHPVNQNHSIKYTHTHTSSNTPTHTRTHTPLVEHQQTASTHVEQSCQPSEGNAMLSDRSGSWHLVTPKDVILSKTICLNDNNNRTSSAAAEKVNSNTSYYLVMSHAKKATEVYQLHHYLRAVGRKVLWSSACVCLCVCLSVRAVFVRKISQERVHGSPPNLVGGSRG